MTASGRFEDFGSLEACNLVMAFDWQVLWNQVLALALNLQTLGLNASILLSAMCQPSDPGFGSFARP